MSINRNAKREKLRQTDRLNAALVNTLQRLTTEQTLVGQFFASQTYAMQQKMLLSKTKRKFLWRKLFGLVSEGNLNDYVE